MNSLRIVFAAAAISILSGCATTLETHADHDRKQNFATYRTYAWISDQPMMTAPGEVRASPLNQRRIEEAIEKEFAGKGFQKAAERDAADFVVSYTVGARDRLDVQSYPTPYRGPWLWGWTYFGQDVDVTTYREGALAIDVFDGKSHQPVWHGWASRRISDADVKNAAELIPPAVASILKRFPPG